MVVVTPAWVTLISISMAIEWMKKIRETPGANVMAINVIKMWMCQLVLGPIYPTYYYIFTTMAERAQNLKFLLLLNYVEVVIPLVFSIYMVTYQLPNREYYAQLHGMTQGELMQTLENVP
ncbi:hypothetical protein PC120_g19566 [Phytophthora cactorum]|nr:hypothetical protein PC120_g19566 [Phytophthora cactorum]